MVECRKCSAQIAESAKCCPQCGIEEPSALQLRQRQATQSVFAGMICTAGIATAAYSESTPLRVGGIAVAMLLAVPTVMYAVFAFYAVQEDE